MDSAAKKYRLRKLVPKILISLGVVLLLPLAACVSLFVVNRFELQIVLKGQDQMTLSWGEEFRDPGAEAMLSGTLLFREGIPVEAKLSTRGEPDMTTPGSYEITYNAEYYYFSSSARRTVRVVDDQAPEITLISIPGTYTIPGEAYQEEGFTAVDDCDGDLTSRVQRQEQDGFVIYSVSDQAGNTTCVRREIRYADLIPPEITLLGAQTIYVDAGNSYEEPGFSAWDNCDGELSHGVTVSGTVDKYLAGSYELTYTVTDSSGNESSAVRTVVVVGKTLPETRTPEGNVIYLTFDDGPGPYTRQLLKILEEYNAKATFFVVDGYNSDIYSEIVSGGHTIGIHSMTHDYKTIYADADAYFQDILTMQRIIYEETGVMTYLMRFPGGSSNTVSSFNPGIMTYLTQAVEDNGFCYFDWNVDSNDAGGASDAKDVFENVTKGVMKRRVSIVLQHDTKDFSVEAVEKILKWGKENGYQFLALDMTSPRAHHGVNN